MIWAISEPETGSFATRFGLYRKAVGNLPASDKIKKPQTTDKKTILKHTMMLQDFRSLRLSRVYTVRCITKSR